MKANSQDSNIIIISDKSCNIVREDDNNSEKHGEIRIGEDGTDDSTKGRAVVLAPASQTPATTASRSLKCILNPTMGSVLSKEKPPQQESTTPWQVNLNCFKMSDVTITKTDSRVNHIPNNREKGMEDMNPEVKEID